MAEFKEEEHPRDDEGKFTSGSQALKNYAGENAHKYESEKKSKNTVSYDVSADIQEKISNQMPKITKFMSDGVISGIEEDGMGENDADLLIEYCQRDPSIKSDLKREFPDIYKAKESKIPTRFKTYIDEDTGTEYCFLEDDYVDELLDKYDGDEDATYYDLVKYEWGITDGDLQAIIEGRNLLKER